MTTSITKAIQVTGETRRGKPLERSRDRGNSLIVLLIITNKVQHMGGLVNPIEVDKVSEKTSVTRASKLHGILRTVHQTLEPSEARYLPPSRIRLVLNSFLIQRANIRSFLWPMEGQIKAPWRFQDEFSQFYDLDPLVFTGVVFEVNTRNNFLSTTETMTINIQCLSYVSRL